MSTDPQHSDYPPSRRRPGPDVARAADAYFHQPQSHGTQGADVQ